MKRIVIETSENKKNALDSALKEYGVSLTEWFNDKLDELVQEPRVEYITKDIDLQQLNEIADSKLVFEKLQTLDWSFTDADTTYLSHNLHPYPAKYIPQLPNQLIRLLSLRGELIWDPFGGSGTTALEALLLGRRAVSTDVNPITQFIGRAKCTTITQEEEKYLQELADRIQLLSSNYQSFKKLFADNFDLIQESYPQVPNREKWFSNEIWDELGYLKWSLNEIEVDKIKIFCLAILSKIIVKVSFQDSETRYVSKQRKVEDGYALKIFSTELISALPKARKLGPLLKFREANFITTDLRFNSSLEDSSVDLIVTSPPYPNATDYHLYHRFRIFWLGFDPVSLGKSEIGSHLRHQKEGNGIEKYLEEMQMCLKHMHSALRPGRYAVLVLGDAHFEGKDFDTAKMVGNEADMVGFEKVGIFVRKVHASKRSFISAARRLKEEKFLVLRKKNYSQKFKLIKPPYKLWPYEDEIRKMEIKQLLDSQKLTHKGQNSYVEVDGMQTDLLKRLTFTHGFEAKDFSKEATWQCIIENGEAIENIPKRKDPKYVTHGIHAYKGKFYPQLAKSLFNLAKLNPGDQVLDPFCGSGTVLLESYLNGLNAYGFDLNPIALKIANAKTKIITEDPFLVDRLLSTLISKIEKAEPKKDYRSIYESDCLAELESWFPINVLAKLATIISEINDTPNLIIKEFLEVCLSSIVREISHQDPKDLRIRRRKEPIEDAPVFELFNEKLLEQRTRLRHFAERSNKSSTVFGRTNVFEADSRTLTEEFFEYKNSIDCVVTSPPYATALPYVDTDRLSILLIMAMKSKSRREIEDSLVGAREITKSGREEIENMIAKNDYREIKSTTAKNIIRKVHDLNFNSNVGFRRKNMASLLFRYFADMTLVMENLDGLMKKGGKLFFVIGDTKTYAGDKEEEIIIKSCKALEEIGKNLGWQHISTIPITVTKENRRHNKNGIIENDIIWFER